MEDHFAILKVGPGVTFALREALWALSDIAAELDIMRGRSLKDEVLEAMRREPWYWKSYYLDADRRRFDLQFSLSDRIRYYWSMPEVTQACTRLLARARGREYPLEFGQPVFYPCSTPRFATADCATIRASSCSTASSTYCATILAPAIRLARTCARSTVEEIMDYLGKTQAELEQAVRLLDAREISQQPAVWTDIEAAHR